MHGHRQPELVHDVADRPGLFADGKTRADLTVSYPGFVVSGVDAEGTAAADKAVRQQIAFYGSTPAYRPVLELHGWGDLQAELNTLSKRGEWVKMGELIDDDVLAAFAVVAEPDGIAPGSGSSPARRMRARRGGSPDASPGSVGTADSSASV